MKIGQEEAHIVSSNGLEMLFLLLCHDARGDHCSSSYQYQLSALVGMEEELLWELGYLSEMGTFINNLEHIDDLLAFGSSISWNSKTILIE